MGKKQTLYDSNFEALAEVALSGDYNDLTNTPVTGVSSVFGRSGAVVAQSGDYNPSQVGLGNVTNDAQLKRAANDFASFTVKSIPTSSDIILIEDAAATNIKKSITIGTIPHSAFSGVGTNTHAQIDSHISNTSNPHGTTASQVGLGNVTNDAQLKRAANDFTAFTNKSSPTTSDILLIEDAAAAGAKKNITIAALPVQTAVQTALNAKANLSGGNSFTGNQNISSGSVGLGFNTAINASALLELRSTTQGLLLPRLTTAQMLAISTPAEGLFVYNTDYKVICWYNGTTWLFEDTHVITAIQSTTSNTFSNITESETPSLPVGTYLFEASYIFQSTATGTGIGFRLNNGTGTIGDISIHWTLSQGENGTNVMFNYTQNATGDNFTSASVSTANLNYTANAKGMFEITSQGTMVSQFRSETNGNSVSIRPNSLYTFKKVA